MFVRPHKAALGRGTERAPVRRVVEAESTQPPRMSMNPSKAQQKLIDAAAKRADGHIIGGDPRTRQALRDRGWSEVYGRNFGPLERLTDAGRAMATAPGDR